MRTSRAFNWETAIKFSLLFKAFVIFSPSFLMQLSNWKKFLRKPTKFLISLKSLTLHSNSKWPSEVLLVSLSSSYSPLPVPSPDSQLLAVFRIYKCCHGTKRLQIPKPDHPSLQSFQLSPFMFSGPYHDCLCLFRMVSLQVILCFSETFYIVIPASWP